MASSSQPSISSEFRPRLPFPQIPSPTEYHQEKSANPFLTPYASQDPSRNTSSAALNQGVATQRYFQSRRVKKGEIERPWTKVKDPKEKWVTIIPLIGMLVGFMIAGYMIWDGLQTVVNHKYCPVYMSDFPNKGWEADIWTKEAEVGGFGNGQFEETTVTTENVFIQDGMLRIKPTLQDPSLIEKNSMINLQAEGICTSSLWSNCITGTNTTNGTIANPAKSGRINTKKGASIKYGRIEVEARLPAGDWLWPAIWMLPVKNVYGEWPQSGEIDIVESRGNNYTYPQGGNNIVSSSLHWGPDSVNDAWWRTNVKRNALHTTFAKQFHTFGLEWSEKYLFTYIDTRLLQVLYTTFDKEGLWERGHFPEANSNGTKYIDPWSQTGRASTPFDQDFYLIMNVAVGGTNGWFQDDKNGKPWVDESPNPRKDFWNGRDSWYPTWNQSGEMVVKSVKVWQQEGYNGCH
ncbi:hypothetical protein LTR10_013445 [Elasticomyces elasticus]|uniref:GH16 domain-containing protein n=1 Tax=Exophiala sideris TaxID=1016849 RepID=A0ABR0J4D9_9EURO|nr:hypothetical protein LTR10_013445 [Elasticomyces elasticus]KAK5027325.1 hypothetical protein LTS07_006927 [Exophiala sideris]KAK5034973.1 hypothetical protein LTR13_006155 [Exophiala sideris]KAK5056293.1 hypothetical protein LTR69_007834 [Exophiala sideris]KAK5181218.1 hypothetical protein LTR44_006549 [Eurotiomycetes sp. CCFEE 6388]